MDFKRFPSKRTSRILLSIILVLGASILLFFSLSGPEAIATRILRSSAEGWGLKEFQLDGLDIRISGRFRAERLNFSGPILSASETIRSIDFSAGAIQGGIRWRSLLKFSKDVPEASLTDWLPRFLGRLETQGANVLVQLAEGPSIEIQELDFAVSRRLGGAIRLDLSAGSIGSGTDILRPLATRLVFGTRLQDFELGPFELRGQSDWGGMTFRGMIEDAAVLKERFSSIREAAELADPDAWPSMLNFLFRELNRSSLSLEGEFQPGERLQRLARTEDWEIDVPQVLEVQADSNAQGFRLRLKASPGRFRTPDLSIEWDSLPLHLSEALLSMGAADATVEWATGLGSPLNLRCEGTIALDRPGFPCLLRAGTVSPADIGALSRPGTLLGNLMGDRWGDPVSIGDASATIFASGRMLPWAIAEASASLSVHLAIHPPGFSRRIPLRGDAGISLQGDRLKVMIDDFLIAGGALDTVLAGKLENGGLPICKGNPNRRNGYSGFARFRRFDSGVRLSLCRREFERSYRFDEGSGCPHGELKRRPRRLRLRTMRWDRWIWPPGFAGKRTGSMSTRSE
jgi:hypothetical protein